jgi:hypothetical protein
MVVRGRRRFGVFISTMATLAGAMATGTPASRADSSEVNFLNAVYPYAHPPVSPQGLIQLGYKACATRRAGGSTSDAKVAVYEALETQGVFSSNAEIGSLVHAAVDTLCPEVGYP